MSIYTRIETARLVGLTDPTRRSTYKRIAALEQLGRDTVGSTVWPMSEPEAPVVSRSLRLARDEVKI